MTRSHFDDDSIRKLLELSESPAGKLARELSDSPTLRLASMVQHSEIQRLISSVQQANAAFGAYSRSQRWAELSAAVSQVKEYVNQPATVEAVRQIEANLKRIALAADGAVLPTSEVIRAYSDSATRAIGAVQAQFAQLESWQASLTQRMSTLAIPWAMDDHIGISVVGFARIARLHGAARDPSPFVGRSTEIFHEELGRPVPFGDHEEDRDSAAVDAGLNPEIIAFPRTAYPTVLISAGFEFRIESIEAVLSTRGDQTGMLDPNFAGLLGQVEHRLRVLIKEELEKLTGGKWYRSRVPGPTYERWKSRKQADCEQRGDSYDLVFYADFMDILEVVCRRDNWEEAFGVYFKSKEDFRVSMQRLSPVRNAVAHNRPLVRSDQITLFSEASRLLTAMGVQF